MTTPYIDPNIIFAENAPTQDKPAAFENYDKGWDESRKNDGRPSIKQMNYLQQQADFKNRYIHENGAALPYKEGIAYEEGAVVVKDGELQQWKGGEWVNVSSQEVKKYLIDAGIDESELDGDYNYLMQRLAQIAVDKGWDASFVIDASGKNQQEINNAIIDSSGKAVASKVFDSSGVTQQDINNLQNSPMFYGAIADGTLHTVNEWTVIGVNRFYPNLAAIQVDYPHVTSLTDSIDWAATVKAMSVKNQVFFGDNSKHYVFNKTAFTNHKQKLFGDGATIRQTKAQTQLFDPSTKTNFVMMGLRLVGMGAADFTNIAGSRSDGVYASAAMGIHIESCQFEALSHSSLTCTQSSNIKFINNTVLGLGSSVLTPTTSHSNCGVVIDKSCVNAVVSGNTLTGMAMGIITGNLCENLRFTDNYIADITGQHGIYINAAQTNVHISGNQIERTSLCGIKIQTYDVETKETNSVVVCSNNIRDVGTDGIVVDNTSATPTYLTKGLLIFGNNIKNAGQDGISVRYAKSGVIDGNVLENITREGLSYSGCDDVTFTQNMVDGTGSSGIREVAASTGCSIHKNTIKNPAKNDVAASRYGIFIGANSNDLSIEDNKVFDNLNNMRYGVYVEAGNVATMVVKGNRSRGASDYGFRTAVAGQAFKYFGDNIFEGTLGSTLGLDTIPLQRGNTGREFFGNAMPTSGTFSKGDYVSNINPSIAGGVVILGWYRVTNGVGHVLNTDWVADKMSTT